MNNKDILDKILFENKAQPVGKGYIDIIVKREYLVKFLNNIYINNFNIICISWWEYCPTMETKNNIGRGGPKSVFFDGWFSEIGEFDDIPQTKNNQEIIMGIIENKYFIIDDKKYTFKDYKILTPAFWLNVPSDWHSIKYNL